MNIGSVAYTPETAMSLAEELSSLRKRVKEQKKEIWRLKEENEFLEEANVFSRPSEPENDVHSHKDGGQQPQRKTFFLLSDDGGKPAGLL